MVDSIPINSTWLEKHNNFVYNTICELSFDYFKKTNFSTFRIFCINFNNLLVINKLDYNETRFILSLLDLLWVCYGLNEKDGIQFIAKFFSEEHYIAFEKTVRFTKESFPECFG